MTDAYIYDALRTPRGKGRKDGSLHEAVALDKALEDPETFAEALVYGNPMIDEIRSRGGVDPDEVASAILDALRARLGPPPLRMPLAAYVFTCQRR